MPNFKKLAKTYHLEAIKTLQSFIQKASVYDEKSIQENAPYGEGVKSALDYVAKLGKEMGFSVDSCQGYCTEISYGNQGKLIGIYAHSDVVPVSGNWKYPPFSGRIDGEGKERRMWGRGTSDDKGPLIAALYAIKLLKDNNLIDDYSVRLVSGGDEERGSSCLENYFHKLNKKPSDYGFTPDADFPLIYAEKGMGGSYLHQEVKLGPVVAMDGGIVGNAVCDRMLVTLPSDKKFIAYLKEKGIDCEINEYPEIMIIAFKGKASHGSVPEKGINAGLIAFKALGEFYQLDFLKNLSFVLADPNGMNFHGDCLSKELGKNTYNYGIIKYDGKTLGISVDFRYGEEADPKLCLKNLKEASKMELETREPVKPLLFAKDSPLVSTLMKSYKRMTHRFFDKPLAIGGGTYAKEAPNCVAYGSAFRNHPGDIHSPNEYIYIDDFLDQIAIYADAIYSLGKIKDR